MHTGRPWPHDLIVSLLNSHPCITLAAGNRSVFSLSLLPPVWLLLAGTVRLSSLSYPLQFDCCGVNSPEDFKDSLFRLINQNHMVPEACCLRATQSEELAYISKEQCLSGNMMFRHNKVTSVSLTPSLPLSLWPPPTVSFLLPPFKPPLAIIRAGGSWGMTPRDCSWLLHGWLVLFHVRLS